MNMLVAFAIGLTAIASGTRTVESDFSSLKRFKRIIHSSISNYALEGEVQSSQYFDPLDLAVHLKTTHNEEQTKYF